MIKFLNTPHGPGENAVIATTPKGNYINAQGDLIQIVAVDCFVCASDYERALPEYSVASIAIMDVPGNPKLLGKFVSVEMVAKQ